MSTCGICQSGENVRFFIQGNRCPEHAPGAEPTGQYCALNRCYCGKPECPAYASYGRPLEAIGWTVNDERAVSSGRRASGATRRRQHAADTYTETGGAA